MSVTVDVPGVTCAVEHLQELAYRMKSDDFGFHDNDVENIDSIIDAIQELENDRLQLHHTLETETISSSILRHQLQIYPSKINVEITDAVTAARQSNAEELQRLQDELAGINQEIEQLDARNQELEKDNAVLHPQRDKVRAEHEEVIAQLNHRMAEKASKQIGLNETRDMLRETNQKIVDLEDGIVSLKEDLIQERADARMEKKRLKKAVYDTTLKTRDQKQMNLAKKKELDSLNEEMMESEGRLDNIRKSIRRYDNSRTRLEGQERALSAQVAKEIKMNQELTVKGENIRAEDKKVKEEFDADKIRLQATIKELDEDIERITEENDEKEIQQLDLEADLRDKTLIRKADDTKVKEMNGVLQVAKGELARKAEDVGRIAQENTEMQTRIIELGETHVAIMATLNKQIEEFRVGLTKERKERMELQGTRDEVQKDIDDFKAENNRHVAEMNRRITEGKVKHDELTKEGTTLQKSLKEDENLIQQLRRDVEKAQKHFEQRNATLQKATEILRAEIVDMEKKVREKTEVVETKKLPYEEMEAAFEERTQSFDKMKKDIVAMKNKKQSLDDSVKRAKRDLEKMKLPRENLKKDLKKGRGNSIEQIKKQSEDISEVEKQVYTIGCKLKSALEENDNFKKGIKKLEQNVQELDQEMDENDQLRDQLQAQFERLRGDLEGGWEKDGQLEKEYTARDEKLVDELGDLLRRTHTREHKISDITDRLQSELVVLSSFLDNVSRRRPKESRQSAHSQSRRSGASSALSDTSRNATPLPGGASVEGSQTARSGASSPAKDGASHQASDGACSPSKDMKGSGEKVPQITIVVPEEKEKKSGSRSAKSKRGQTDPQHGSKSPTKASDQ